MRKAYISMLLVLSIACNLNAPIIAEASSPDTLIVASTDSSAVYVQSLARGVYEEAEHTISYIYTPNGTPVLVKHYTDEHSADYVDYLLSVYSTTSPYKDAILLDNPTTAYNCHSYAWYSQNTSTNAYWMPYPTEYYIDYSYHEVSTPREGDIICYFDDKGTAAVSDDENLHSGIVESVNSSQVNNICGKASLVNVTSKWGPQGLFYHRGDICPYVSTYSGDADYVKFYRPKTHGSYTLSTSMNDRSFSRTLNGNGSITAKYGMYELNVTNAGKYTITVQSSYGLSTRLYNANMNLMTMTSPASGTGNYTYVATLSAGRYYLRTAYSNTANSGTISITIEPHSHSYDWWTYYNNSTHIKSCCCGLKGTATASHFVRSSDIVDNKANCIGCGRMLDLNLDNATITPDNAAKVSVNGSYILPSGIIVLVDEDVEAYLNGTLVFYDPNDLPVAA